MSRKTEWELFLGKWLAPDIRWQAPYGANCCFRPDQFGRVRFVCYTFCLPPDGFFTVLRDEVLPAARAAVPPVKGRYSYPGSDLRNRYLEAIARELNARKLFPVLP
jgi:hypothetical protein